MNKSNKSQLAYTLPNIKNYKYNPYLKNLSKEEYEKVNNSLFIPYNNELFIDDDGFQWICKIDDNGNITYESKEKELEDKNQKKFKKLFIGFAIFDALFIIGMIILYIIETRS